MKWLSYFEINWLFEIYFIFFFLNFNFQSIIFKLRDPQNSKPLWVKYARTNCLYICMDQFLILFFELNMECPKVVYIFYEFQSIHHILKHFHSLHCVSISLERGPKNDHNIWLVLWQCINFLITLLWWNTFIKLTAVLSFNTKFSSISRNLAYSELIHSDLCKIKYF